MQTLTENLEKHEAAFRKIQMASGLHTAEEIIDNYTNREKILRAVKSKVDVLQTQLTKAQERHDRAKTDLDAEKYEATPGRGVACSCSGHIAYAFSTLLFLLVCFCVSEMCITKTTTCTRPSSQVGRVQVHVPHSTM